jgi:hypothetical protein
VSNFVINPYAFTAASGSGPDGTAYYVEVTIPDDNVGDDLTNYPVYVDLADMPAGFWSNAQSDGGDIRVTQADGTTRCAVDLVAINTGTETGELHFLASTLSDSVDNVYRVYYGHGALSQPAAGTTYGRNAVWGDYDRVLHMSENPGGTAPQMLDSTGNSNDGSTAGVMTIDDLVTGRVGTGITLDGSNDIITMPSTDLPQLTIQAIVYFNKFTATGPNHVQRIATKFNGNTGSVSGRWLIDTWSGGAASPQTGLRFYVHLAGGVVTAVAGLGTFTISTWHHVVCTHDGSNIRAYVDGVQVATAAASGDLANLSQTITIGEDSPAGASEYLGATVDEFRMRGNAVSAAWIAAEHANHSDPDSFYAVGSEQSA